MNIFASIGGIALQFLRSIGHVTLFAGQSLISIVTPPFYFKALASALLRIGFQSLPVIGLTAIFTGAALALNIYEGSLRFNAEAFLPQILGVSITRELGPVLAALMVAGRSSSTIAAEIGTMRVTEQIDAMTTLAVKPFHYLIAPRILATIIALPLLVLIVSDFLALKDVTSGLYKASIFGFLLSLMGCYHGFHSERGAQGVGKATRSAVVASAMLILASNYFMTVLFVGV